MDGASVTGTAGIAGFSRFSRFSRFIGYRQLVLIAGLMCVSDLLRAEPYLAIREGLPCAGCHVNPSGGGQRNAAGRAYGERALPARNTASITPHPFGERFDIGADLRTSLSAYDIPGESGSVEFATERASVYVDATLLRGRLDVYLDQQFSPASDSREAWLRLSSSDGTRYLKAGRLSLPYGLRLQDDSAYVRRQTGMNFLSADDGVEIGIRTGDWFSQVAITNGSFGAGETNRDKLLTGSTVHIKPGARAGASIGVNGSDDGRDRLMTAAFAGFRRFGMEWLAEVDWIRDANASESGGDIEQLVSLFEVNRAVRPGSNLKVTLEFLDPDRDIREDHQSRVSLVWEWTPLPSLQLRLGTRQAAGIPQNPAQNTDQYFLQLHAWY